MSPPLDLTLTCITAGQVACPSEPTTIVTTLGSCVAVCVFDLYGQRGGMNHFVLPGSSTGKRSTYSYGSDATRELIDAMCRAGAHKRSLSAKLFGGATPLTAGRKSSFAVGEANIATARAILAEYEIPVTAERLGGTNGLKIRFETWSGKVQVQALPSLSKSAVSDIVPKKPAIFEYY